MAAIPTTQETRNKQERKESDEKILEGQKIPKKIKIKVTIFNHEIKTKSLRILLQ
uniref:Uncharacterized protein n=1 Tax=Rhizophora mucronata TaxID=61149 RepID=A0A2P2IKV8_RHIMU